MSLSTKQGWVPPSSCFTESPSHSLPHPLPLPGPWSPSSFQTAPPDPGRVSQDGPIPVPSPWLLMLCTAPARLTSASCRPAHRRRTVTVAGVSSKCQAQVGVLREKALPGAGHSVGTEGCGQESPATGKAWGPLGQQHPSYVTCGSQHAVDKGERGCPSHEKYIFSKRNQPETITGQ